MFVYCFQLSISARARSFFFRRDGASTHSRGGVPSGGTTDVGRRARRERSQKRTSPSAADASAEEDGCVRAMDDERTSTSQRPPPVFEDVAAQPRRTAIVREGPTAGAEDVAGREGRGEGRGRPLF